MLLLGRLYGAVRVGFLLLYVLWVVLEKLFDWLLLLLLLLLIVH
jgi:hypothetical protein